MLAAVKLEGLTSELPATAPRLGKGMNTRVREPHEWHRPSVKAAGRRAGLNSLLVKTNGPAFRGLIFGARKAPRGDDQQLSRLLPGAHIGVDVSVLEGHVDPAVGTALSTRVLGIVGVGFLATFGVAPIFKESLKEPLSWNDDIFPQLVARQVQSVSPSQAQQLVKRGAVLLDVDLASVHSECSANGSINYPLYRPIEDWDLASTARRAAFTFFGIPGTERNPEWLKDVEANIRKDKQVIVMCSFGGSIIPKTGATYGFQSRSLKAIYFLQEAGFKQVLHLQGGFEEWKREGLPVIYNT